MNTENNKVESYNDISNTDLFDDPKDIKITKLKKTIENYKKYDVERQKYYSKALQRLGMLESAFGELQDSDNDLNRLKARIIAQRLEIERLLKLQNLRELYKRIEPSMIDNEISMAKLMIENEELNRRVESLNYIVSKLLRKE